MQSIYWFDFRGLSPLKGHPDEALQLAVAFLANSQESNGLLIVPYNSVQYLTSRDVGEQLLGCWPILVDLERGDVRSGTLDERHLWRNPNS
ncbi:YrhB domain-containing protein [Streptomyces sp. NPDC001450]